MIQNNAQCSPSVPALGSHQVYRQARHTARVHHLVPRQVRPLAPRQACNLVPHQFHRLVLRQARSLVLDTVSDEVRHLDYHVPQRNHDWVHRNQTHHLFFFCNNMGNTKDLFLCQF